MGQMAQMGQMGQMGQMAQIVLGFIYNIDIQGISDQRKNFLGN